jgi:uncharacterized protein (UPF0332 family)
MRQHEAFFTKATQELTTAELAFQSGDFNSTANRAYFAAFHAPIAVLALDGMTNSTNEHKWVHTTFSTHCIHRRKLFPSALASMLPDMMTIRHKADYDTSDVSKKEVAQQLKKSQQFCFILQQKAESWT